MNGNVDDYSQMRVFLSEEDVKTLEKEGAIIGEIWGPDNITIPLRINYVDTDHAIQDELPKDKELRSRRGYEIYVGRKGLRLIKEREVVSQVCVFEPRFIRFLYLSLNDVL